MTAVDLQAFRSSIQQRAQEVTSERHDLQAEEHALYQVLAALDEFAAFVPAPEASAVADERDCPDHSACDLQDDGSCRMCPNLFPDRAQPSEPAAYITEITHGVNPDIASNTPRQQPRRGH